jgi:hypothetical protein
MSLASAEWLTTSNRKAGFKKYNSSITEDTASDALKTTLTTHRPPVKSSSESRRRGLKNPFFVAAVSPPFSRFFLQFFFGFFGDAFYSL